MEQSMFEFDKTRLPVHAETMFWPMPEQRVDDHQAAPIRVIHVGQSMVRAGIEQWLKGLIRCSDPRRVQFLRCIVTTNQIDPEVIAEIGAPVEVGGPDSVRRAARECDVLLCWGPRELATWLDAAHPKLCVFVAHGESEWTRNILEGCRPVVDHVIAISPRVQQQVCAGFPSTLILNGIDATHIAVSRPRPLVRDALGFGRDDFVLGFVGRFSPEKRPQAMIEALADAPRHCKALLVGWGPLQRELLDLANRCIPGRYAFMTAKCYLGDYYQAMDAFCLPSANEGFGLVVLEAMLCGVPVIATPVGCVPELIQDRVSGLIVSGEPSSIRTALELVERHPRWARAVAAEGRAQAEQVGFAHRMAGDYQRLFEELLNARNGSSGPRS